MAEFKLPEPKEISYRLYYNEQGYPICWTMEDLPGNYIEIDIETYRSGSPHVRVINGRVHQLASAKTTSKLVPGDIGQSCDPRDVCVVVDASQENTKWSLKTYELP